MRLRARNTVKAIINVMSGRCFFLCVLVLFFLQALWIAFSFCYPMIFDETYHMGLIRYFSDHLVPWINDQPTALDQYGTLTRSPYLLYHYLMSFPYRFIELFTDVASIQTIFMRIINIVLFTGGLVVFKKLFDRMGVKSIFSNIVLLFIVLLPVAPFVAATVNYDNAIFLLTALFMLIGVNIIRSKSAKWSWYAQMILIGMTGSLMKVSFLPIFATAFVFLVINVLRMQRKSFISEIKESFFDLNVKLRVIILVPLIVIGFMFIERFGVNIVVYHSLSPSCDRLMTMDRCMSNRIAVRDAALLEKKNSSAAAPMSIQKYSATWYDNMVLTSLYTGSTRTVDRDVVGLPTPIIYFVVFFGGILSFAMFSYGFREIRRLKGFWLVFIICIMYSLALFYTTISGYYKYLEPALAVQGRYLLPILPAILLFSVIGMNYAMKKRHVLKFTILIMVLTLYLNGAGITVHIVRSDDSWYWDNSVVRIVNEKARKILRPIIKEE